MAAPDSPSSPHGIVRPTPVSPGTGRSFSTLTAPLTIALVIAALYFGRRVLVPLALAVLLAFVLTPVVARLEKWGLHRFLSVLLVVATALLLLGILAWTVSGQLIEIAGQLPEYEANVYKKVESFQGPKHGRLSEAFNAIRQLGEELRGAPKVRHPPARGASAAPHERVIPVQEVRPQESALSELRGAVRPLLGPLGTAGIVLIFTIFMLAKREDLRNRVMRFAGRGRLSVLTAALDDGTRRLSHYLLLQALVNTGYGVLVGIALYLIGVPHALLWAVLTAILRYIPYVGILIAASLPIAMALGAFPGWTQAILTICLFAVMEGTIASFIEPLLYGSRTGISALAVLVAAVFWTMLWGPVGLFLSTPLTVCVIVLGRHVPQLRFLEIALGDEPALSPEVHFYQRLLAMDEEEMRDIAEESLRETPLVGFYQQVIIPALGLAEQDRHANALDQQRHEFICQEMRELVEELGERLPPEGAGTAQENGEVVCPPRSDGHTISLLCVPARDDADEIVAMIVAQIVSREGFPARFLPIGAVADMLAQVEKQKPDVVCVSALPPAALGQARSLCKRLRMQSAELKILLGLWNFEGGLARAQERSAGASANLVVTTLPEVTLQIRQLAQCVSPEVGGTPVEARGS